MSRKIILSGVHGVGKGYFIKSRLAHISNLTVISASEIISQYHDAEDAGNKRVKNVGENQKLLFETLKLYFDKHKETVLLDGHLVILDENDSIQRIPLSFFEGMFDTIILLQDDVDSIYDRMYKRDGVHKLEKNLIEQIQEKEREYAKELEQQGIEVCYITASSKEETYSHLF